MTLLPGLRARLEQHFCCPVLDLYSMNESGRSRCSIPEPVLLELEGRAPLRYRTSSGTWLNNVEITHALRPLPLAQYCVHQDAEGEVAVQYSGSLVEPTQVRTALLNVFGRAARITVEPRGSFGDKVIQYTSALPGALV